jgi:hypothetical protein
MKDLNANLNKKCPKCLELKPISDYYCNKNRLQSYCKICSNINTYKYSKNDRERDKLYRRERRKLHPEIISEQNKKYRLGNKDKIKTHHEVSKALKKGEIDKLPCSVCGESRVVGHHPDYSKPLAVVWLCEAHHRAEHNRITRKADAFMAYYGMSSALLLEVLYKENGISRSQQDRRVDRSLQTKEDTSCIKGSMVK